MTGNDAASVVLNPLAALADLALTKISTQEPVPNAPTSHYVVVVTNLGTGDATGVTMTDNLAGRRHPGHRHPEPGQLLGSVTTVTCGLGNHARRRQRDHRPGGHQDRSAGR